MCFMIKIIFEFTTFKMTFRNRERRFRALVLQNHPKSIRLFDHSEIVICTTSCESHTFFDEFAI
jgi:hypothetical protein